MGRSDDPEIRKVATQNVRNAAVLATMRTIMGPPSSFRMAVFGLLQDKPLERRIYTLGNEEPDPGSLPGKIVRKEGDPPSADAAVNEAYDGSGNVHEFYKAIFDRNSLDDNCMPLVSTVHAGDGFDNAFWNGQQMVYGDGDNVIFTRFTAALDVIGHELTHGVVSHECDLIYQDESGALNESFADVFGVMISQYFKKQTVDQADWLVGKDIMVASPGRHALRSMKAPGTAYTNDPMLGNDPQPAHMDNKYTGGRDRGGVHINSGIPNHAFYLAAMAVGGNAWGPVGKVWYGAMRALQSTATFADMAKCTRSIARANQPAEVTKAIDEAWTQVGL